MLGRPAQILLSASGLTPGNLFPIHLMICCVWGEWAWLLATFERQRFVKYGRLLSAVIKSLIIFELGMANFFSFPSSMPGQRPAIGILTTCFPGRIWE